jgi:oxalate decarboxylase/phosphoglucose isomerase-like protein (cupin superfamily)
MRIKKREYEDHNHVKKTWGHETWIENSPLYCGKILFVEKGKHSSMHFHLKKTETMLCIDGSFEMKLIDPEVGEQYSVYLVKGESLLIEPGQLHEIHGLDDVNTLIEFSTTHEDSDSYRAGKPSK